MVSRKISTTVLLVIVCCAILAFGGSFTCSSGDDGRVPTTNHR